MVREVFVDTGGDDTKAAEAAKPAARTGRARKRKVAVFIDGSNFYFKMRSLIPAKTDFISYRYRDLIRQLLNDDEQLGYIGYYVGVVRDTKRTSNHEKALELIQNQQRLFEQLRHQQIHLVKGYLLERDGKFFEKGVDVRLALDIVTMAQDRKYDVGYVVSSDTDLIPALQAAQARKREVVHVGFEHQPSLALMRCANRSRIIGRREAERFTAKQLEVRRYDDD
jgi:uncharacterized LabA/DUF88 family protein